jgi:hypothetical protein
MREIGPDGFGKKVREWNSTELLENWREDYATKAADMLERCGHHIDAERWRYGHMTQAQQLEKALERGDLEFAATCELDATKHRGPTLDAMMERGVESEAQERRAEELNLVWNLSNDEIDALLAECAQIDAEIRELSVTNTMENEEVSRTVAEIRFAYKASDSPKAFQAALEEVGIHLARTDFADAVQSQAAHKLAQEEGRSCPRYHFGEYVAVNEYGHIYSLNRYTTDNSRAAVERFFKGFEGAEDVKAIHTTVRDVRLSWREERPRDDYEKPTYELGHSVLDGVEAGFGTATKIAGKLLDSFARVGEGFVLYLGDLFGGASQPTPEQVEVQRADRADRAGQAEALEIDIHRYHRDDEYRRFVIDHQAAEQQRQRDSDDYRKRSIERER